MIANHIAPKLSQLDLLMAQHVPPGGNWKNIPTSVPSKRLEQIRESFARGEGSRSTYYGRLREDRPAYTISTYFSRPGNGCHLHYDQAQCRTLSYREAARVQSFPDDFAFQGPNTAIANQIGNAVPPLLAFSLAKCFRSPGALVDLFAGAGGLSLGFHWAGWKGLVANDIDKHAMQTFAANIHDQTIVGDIRDGSVRSGIINAVESANRAQPIILIGGPPCQGFSTAGNKRSREDDRNHLFKDYCDLVNATDPDAFVFENVPGLLNMEKGAVFAEVQAALRRICVELRVWKVNADDYGVPQRRQRVILVGFRRASPFQLPAAPFGDGLFGRTVTVGEAIGDLPALIAGEDGRQKQYLGPPISAYQRLMRGACTAAQFLSEPFGLSAA